MSVSAKPLQVYLDNTTPLDFQKWFFVTTNNWPGAFVGEWSRHWPTFTGRKPVPPEWARELRLSSQDATITFSLSWIGPNRTIVAVRWRGDSAKELLAFLLGEMEQAWLETQDAIQRYLSEIYPETKPTTTEAVGEAKAEGVKAGSQTAVMPKRKRLAIPDYRTGLPAAYWKYVEEHGGRPSNSDLAGVFSVDEKTIDRRIGDIRKEGGTWPPPPPKPA